MSYTIAVDSSSNLMPRQGMQIVPLKIITDTREFIDDAKLDLQEMLQHLKEHKGPSGTSCPNVGDWLDAVGDSIHCFVVTITSQLSGAYNAALQAAGILREEGREICVLDTRSAGPELTLICQELERLQELGLSFRETENRIRAYMEHTHLIFSLESLLNLSRNGRVSPLVAKAIGLLGIRLVGRASDEGTLEPKLKCRGAKKALEGLLTQLTELGFSGGRVQIDHCENPEGAQALKNAILERWPQSIVNIGSCAGLCSYYAENGGLLVGFEDGNL